MKKRTYGSGYVRPRGKNKWQLQYRVEGELKPRNETITARTKLQAETELSRRVTNPAILSKTASSTPTLAMCFDLHLAALRRKGKKDRAIVEMRINKHLMPQFGSLPAAQFTSVDAIRYIESRLKSGAKPSTVNRETSALRQSLKQAKKQGWIAAVPEIENLNESGNRRRGFMEYEQYQTMLSCLPDHQKMLLCFACHTGVRRGELLSLQWSWMDWNAMVFRIPGQYCKNNEDHVIPVYGPMVEFLKFAYQSRNPLCPYVFQYRNRRLKDIRGGWEAARIRAGLPRFLFHDMRRTAARFMERANIPRSVAKSIGGWLTDSMWNRYLIGAEKDTIEAGQTLNGYFSRFNQIDGKLTAADSTAPNTSEFTKEDKLLN